MEKAPRTMIQRALLWELDRDLGSGREPYMKSGSSVVQLATASRAVLPVWSRLVKPMRRPCRLRTASTCASTGRSRVRSWWSSSAHGWVRRSGKMMDKPALGKPRDALTMLRKMAIVRLKANGYSLRTAEQIFPEKKRFVESLKKINWTTASREVEKAMNLRRNNLKIIERSLGGKNWKSSLYQNA